MIRGLRAVVVIGLVLAAGLLATACGSSDSETSDVTTQAATEATTTAQATTTEASTEATETESTEPEGDLANDRPQTAAATAAQEINRYLFRTTRNRVVCGLDEGDLVCIVTASGATVTLPPKGRPHVKVEDKDRGVPSRARSAPILKKGRAVSRGVYRCALNKGEVRCTNGNRHGFQLGANSIFRF